MAIQHESFSSHRPTVDQRRPNYFARRATAGLLVLGGLQVAGVNVAGGAEATVRAAGAAVESVLPDPNATSDGYKKEIKQGKVTEYTVQPGDTAWQIAREVVGPEREVRDLANELTRQADADGDGMQPGEQLLIPDSEQQSR